MRDAPRLVAARVGHSARPREYGVEREKLIAESLEAGDPKSLPPPSTIQIRFGTWDEALKAANLEPLGGRLSYSRKGDRGGRKGPQIPTAEIVAVLREAYAELGEPFTWAAYKKWRVEQKRRNLEQRRFRRLASVDVVRTRFGVWANATAVARGDSDGASPGGRSSTHAHEGLVG